MPAIRLSDAANKGEDPNMGKEPVMCSEHPKTPMLCPKCDTDEIKNLTASEHTHQGPKVIRLSEVKRNAQGTIDLALLGNDEVVSGEVFRAYQQERVALSEVATAIEKGRIKPADRDRWTKIALSDVESFRDLTKDMKAVDLAEHGHAGAGSATASKELEQVQVQLSERADVIAREKKIPFGDALKEASREKPELLRRRNILTAQAHGADKGDDE